MRRWDELTKKQKKHIREMAGVAYERAMTAALNKLLASFQKWKQDGMTPFDLDEEIHRYHNGTSRDLYKHYGTGDPDMAVLIALAKGILKIEDLNEDCRSFYQERMDRLRDRQE
jgi:TRAP-type C4-dicarboxylate transport system substrate-binding protein